MGGGVLDTAGGAERHLLDDVGDTETKGAAVTVEVLDHGGEILKGDDDLGNAVVFEQLKDMTGFHSLCPETVGQWSVTRGLRWPLVKVTGRCRYMGGQG